MSLEERIQALEVLQARMAASAPKPLRPFSQTISWESRGIMAIGPRGIGKTTLLLHKSSGQFFLYLSLDNPLTMGPTLWVLGETAFMKGYRGLICDEVHSAVDWSRHLKSLYDAFPDRCIWASDSCSLVMRKGLADLSRRFPVLELPLLSFREYLLLLKGIEIPRLDPFETSPGEVAEFVSRFNPLPLFKDYLSEGMRPFFLEGDYQKRLSNILEKSLYADIPFFVPQLSENHLRLMKAIVSYLALSDVPTLNVEAFCSRWGLGKAKLYSLFEVMEAVGVLRIIRKRKDFRAMSKGDKIYLHDPSLYALYGENRGTVREAFVAAALGNAGHQVWASEDERDADLVAGEISLEIGGASKKEKKADFVIRDDIDIPKGKAIPLWLLGLAW